jgi:GAF domain-containing protein
MALVLVAVVLAVLLAVVFQVDRRRDRDRAAIDERSTLENLNRLQALEGLGLIDGPRRPELDELTATAAHQLGTPTSVMTLVDGTHQHFAGAYGVEGGGDTGLDYSYCKHVVAFGRPVAITDSTVDPLVRRNRATTERGVRSYLGVPLRTSNGQTVGSFCVFDNVSREWSRDDEQHLLDLAAEAMRRAEAKAAQH